MFGHPTKRKRKESSKDKIMAQLLADVQEDLQHLTTTSTLDLLLEDHSGSCDQDSTPQPAATVEEAIPDVASISVLPAVTASLPLLNKILKQSSAQTSKRGHVCKRSAATQASVKSECKGTSTVSAVKMTSVGIQCSLLEPPLHDYDNTVKPGSAHDQMDPTWQPPLATAQESDEEDFDSKCDRLKSSSPEKEKKFLVFESCLLELFTSCPACNLPTSVKKTYVGTFLSRSVSIVLSLVGIVNPT
ncbi:uncharacterized protein [Haliotis asinina]|uniref:uncharacterized protein isoform X2 n=1 Tax=Haliotis asinina TaxID=109174 RepID=UPI003531C230